MRCAVNKCERGSYCRGYCKLHYERFKRHGDPLVLKKRLSPRGEPMRWIAEHVEHSGSECLLWPFARFPDGRAHMKSGKPTRIMCELRNGPPPSRAHEAAHRCGNGHRACVNPNHLYWATPVENARDKEAHGTVIRGERHCFAKLSHEDVLSIRAQATVSTLSNLAHEYGVSPTSIWKIVKRKRWRHI